MESSSITPGNIAMLVHGEEVYGIATIIKLYAKAWPEMTFVCNGKGPLLDWLGQHCERVIELPRIERVKIPANPVTLALGWRKQMGAVRRQVELTIDKFGDRDIKVVHTHRLTEQIMAGYLREQGYKAAWQINNNSNRSRLAGIGTMLNHRLAKWGADLLLPASDFIAANWQGSGVPMKTIRNSAEIVSEYRDAQPTPPVRCLVAGRLEESKGHHVAVGAVIAAREKGHDVQLDIFGGPLEDNDYKEQMAKEISSAGADEAIQFRGFCNDLRQRHGDYHIGMQCRIDPEPCSLWVCETMVDGIPLLASATGGTPELVDDGVTGLLYPPGDVAALSERLIELCADPVRLDTMRREAYDRGRSHFVIDRMARETLESYQSLFV